MDKQLLALTKLRDSRVIRDPVYGYIELPDSLAPLVDHPLYQRLRRVSQTSLTSVVYPSATGTRFEHGLGAMHLARRGWRAAWRNATVGEAGHFTNAVSSDISLPAGRFSRLIEDAVGGVALLHDLGHPPFSHVLEPAFRQLAWSWFELASPASDFATEDERRVRKEVGQTQRAFHEGAGRVLLHQILAETVGHIEPLLQEMIREVFLAQPHKGTWQSALHGIIDGEVDIDRLDYLMRDAQKAGTEFGELDYERLIDALELHEHEGGHFAIGPGIRARSAIESLLLQRSQSYKWITFHPRVVGTNLALGRAVEMAVLRADLDSERPQLPGVNPAPWDSVNYLNPGERYVQELLAGRGVEHDMSTVRTLLTENRAMLQAGVDDHRLTELVKSELVEVTARLAGQTSGVGGDYESLARFSTYARAALLRIKNLLPVWKTVEEFHGVAQRLLEAGLRERVDEAYGDLEVQFASQARAVAWLRQRRKASRERLDPDGGLPVVGLNHLLRELVADRQGQMDLAAMLARRPGLPKGFWDIEFPRFKSLRQRGRYVVAYVDDRAVPLVTTSPLIAALRDVDETSVSTWLFYFIEDEHGVEAWRHHRLGLARAELQGAFVRTFPDFAHDGVRRLFEEFLSRPRQEHGRPSR